MSSASRLLVINTSANLKNGYSRNLASAFVNSWKKKYPNVHVTERDIAKQPIPHFSEPGLEAIRTNTPIEELSSAESVAARKLSDELVAELKDSDAILFSVPMYNFNIPSTLKAYLDHVIRMGITFDYVDDKVAGLIKGKKVFIIATAGGGALGSDMDFQQKYLEKVFSYTGLDEDLKIFTVGHLLFPQAEKMAEEGRKEIESYIEQL